MIPLSHGLILAFFLFSLGFVSLVMHKNILFMLISLEIMINSAALALVVVGNYWNQVDGQIMYILILTLGASESSIGLALLIQCYRHFKTLNIDKLSEMNG
ncbi:NADH dehydrogenase I chain K [Buchnera aphidicola str. Bp (Baizongia pistaciae)]|uniref:NADH-quinone oxidoreductase subunit K n=1 Tax=Buchnera aphidicola subsp. Baizongia pistaciae (strain Bp) TaxID=224915 RepID=NUOK_BUCBP|nr:NADH-quinone oxidoreductase subunit NuoK [Buchnera aphidicola]Q89AT7.1 RecName: Full=NADH-quinone oxidoreductase subunit K; AltName: Full=NADH dehydrogenase I subunit K; AltName: Full=NDH-1 subunit K [Buchnera aphidicola str. Bp (Baizongia pistaciae)]AAO26886.1 NADH dehydrogenase I chain K [Buchnera aphidicola str. Bp (Baizongia pistaciae)]